MTAILGYDEKNGCRVCHSISAPVCCDANTYQGGGWWCATCCPYKAEHVETARINEERLAAEDNTKLVAAIRRTIEGQGKWQSANDVLNNIRSILGIERT